MSSILRTGTMWGVAIECLKGIEPKSTIITYGVELPTSCLVMCTLLKSLWDILPSRVTNFTLKERCINAVTTSARWSTFTPIFYATCGLAFGALQIIPSGDPTIRSMVTISSLVIEGVNSSISKLPYIAASGALVGFIGDRSAPPPPPLPQQLASS